MQELAGRVAFITGGAGGIGLAMAEAFADAGMKIVVADLDKAALGQVAERFRGRNVPVLTLPLDVTDRDAFEQAADAAISEFGAIHVLCNNAGVYRGGALQKVTYQDWDWVMDVNVGGVVNGLQSIVPRIVAQGEGGHVVNTASMAGLAGSAGMGIYNASKFAVVGMSEALRADLEPEGVGVSVLCPGMVRTRILESERNRPEERQPQDAMAEQAAQSQSAFMHAMMATGIDPAEVGQMVLDGVRENRFWLLTHPEMRMMVEARQQDLLQSFAEPDPERAAHLEKVLTELAMAAEQQR